MKVKQLICALKEIDEDYEVVFENTDHQDVGRTDEYRIDAVCEGKRKKSTYGKGIVSMEGSLWRSKS